MAANVYEKRKCLSFTIRANKENHRNSKKKKEGTSLDCTWINVYIAIKMNPQFLKKTFFVF